MYYIILHAFVTLHRNQKESVIRIMCMQLIISFV